MPNYRGGDIQRSGYYADLIKAINAGRTEGQYQRDLRKRIIGAVAQAGLQGVSGAIKGSVSADEQQKAEAKDREAARDAYANSPTKDYVSNPKIADRSQGPSWLTAGGVGNVSGIEHNDENEMDPGNDGSAGTVNPNGSVNGPNLPPNASPEATDQAFSASPRQYTTGPGGVMGNGSANGFEPQGGMMGTMPRKVWR